MHKHKTLYITAILFFLLLNSTYFWEGMLGPWALLEVALFVLIFIILTVALFRQLYIAFKERFKIKSRLYLIIVLALVMITTVLMPRGLINFQAFEDKDVLVASRGGVAGCVTILN